MTRPVNTTGCSVEECDEPYSARGFCIGHYDKFRRHGDPLHTGRKESSLKIGGIAIIGRDPVDGEAAIYRYLDDSGETFYIGQTINGLRARFISSRNNRRHPELSEKLRSLSTMTVEAILYVPVEERTLLERVAIHAAREAGNPLLNRDDTPEHLAELSRRGAIQHQNNPTYASARGILGAASRWNGGAAR